MRILLTGAGGQVGTDLIPLLLSMGHEVTGFDLAPAAGKAVPAAGKGAPAGKAPAWIRGDVTVPEEVHGAVQACDAESIWHLAAILSATGEKIPFRAWRVNMDGTRNVLEAARLFGAKQVVFTSTIAAFGPGLSDPVGNDVSMRPTTMYGLTKVAGELLGEWYATKFGLDFRGVRFPGLISLVEPGGGTSDYVNWMYFDGVRKGAYEAFVTPETRIPLMYMPDALRALVQLATVPRSRLTRSIYNIAAMSPRADEIAAAVVRRVPGTRITFRSDPVRQAIVDSWPRALDDTVARRDWGWAPRHDLESMSDELVAAVRAAAAPGAAPPSGTKSAGVSAPAGKGSGKSLAKRAAASPAGKPKKPASSRR